MPGRRDRTGRPGPLAAGLGRPGLPRRGGHARLPDLGSGQGHQAGPARGPGRRPAPPDRADAAPGPTGAAPDEPRTGSVAARDAPAARPGRRRPRGGGVRGHRTGADARLEQRPGTAACAAAGPGGDRAAQPGLGQAVLGARAAARPPGGPARAFEFAVARGETVSRALTDPLARLVDAPARADTRPVPATPSPPPSLAPVVPEPGRP